MAAQDEMIQTSSNSTGSNLYQGNLASQVASSSSSSGYQGNLGSGGSSFFQPTSSSSSSSGYQGNLTSERLLPSRTTIKK